MYNILLYPTSAGIVMDNFEKLSITLTALALVAGAGVGGRVSAQGASPFPSIRAWAFPGSWQDSTLISPTRCAGSFQGPLADSVRQQPRSLTLRFLRDRRAEARPDFGGYRIYRMTATTDTSRGVLLRPLSRATRKALRQLAATVVAATRWSGPVRP